ncbi:hypothetical protein [Variovorax gossypii]
MLATQPGLGWRISRSQLPVFDMSFQRQHVDDYDDINGREVGRALMACGWEYLGSTLRIDALAPAIPAGPPQAMDGGGQCLGRADPVAGGPSRAQSQLRRGARAPRPRTGPVTQLLRSRRICDGRNIEFPDAPAPHLHQHPVPHHQRSIAGHRELTGRAGLP